MFFYYFRNYILAYLFFFSGMRVVAFQETTPRFTDKDFEAIHAIFEHRVERFRVEKIRITPSFRDTIFSIQKWAQQNGTRKQQLLTDFQVFFVYNQLIDNENIIKLGLELLNQKDFLELPESSYTAREILTSYYRKGFYKKQLELFPLYKQLNRKHNYNAEDKNVREYSKLAMIYYRLADYNNARENFILEANYLFDKKDFFKAASMYNNIALTYENQYDYKNAMHYFNKALVLIDQDAETDKDFTKDYKKHFKTVVASNIATIKVKNMDLEGTEDAFLSELRTSKHLNSPRSIIQSYLNLSELNLLNKNFEKSTKYLDSSFILLQSFESITLLSKAYSLQAKNLLTENKIKEAERYFLKTIRIKDSLQQLQILKEVEESSLIYNLDIIKDELSSSKKIIAQQNKITLYQWFFLVIVLIAGGIFYTQKVNIKKKNKAISKNRKELAEALKSNQILLKEISHRIKNNLQIIAGILELKSSKLSEQNGLETYMETLEYINSMAYVHSHLYEQGAKSVLNMQQYLEDLTAAVSKNYVAVFIDINIDASTYLEAEKATPLGLIVCELVTNSAKHAFTKKGSITITLEEKNNQYYFYYNDNGKGFDLNGKLTNNQIGLNLIHVLIEELNGKGDIYIDNGFHLTLNFE